MSRAKTLSAAIKSISPCFGQGIVRQLKMMGFDLTVTPATPEDKEIEEFKDSLIMDLASGDKILVDLTSEWDIGDAYKKLNGAIDKIWTEKGVYE